MTPPDLADRSAAEVARLVRTGRASPVEVLDACLARVEQRNREINAVVTLNPRAMDDARALERRLKRGAKRGTKGGVKAGPLAGVVVGIKDLTPVAGLRMTHGSKIHAHDVATDDAVIVQRLRAAGAIILGKTNTPEFGAGANTFNEVFGRTRNPYDPSRSAGGSTGGGAAALATGMIALAEGTDLGGSLRIPASFCGVVGLRPSVGLVPMHPTDWVWDTLSVDGPMARTVEDVALMLQVVAGPSPYAPLALPVQGRHFVAAAKQGIRRGARVAYCADIAGIGIDEGIERVCRDAAFALRRGGVKVEEIEFDLSGAKPSFLALRGAWFVNWTHERMAKRDLFGVNVRNNVASGLTLTSAHLAEAEAVRGRVWHRFREFFTTYDHLLTPCVAVPPYPVEQNHPDTVGGKKLETYVDWIAPTFVLSITGLPVASVPCGFDANGMPVGLQVVGPQFGEESVLAGAAAIERVRA